MEFSSLGGWVATRASGMKKNIYGNIEDLVGAELPPAAPGKGEWSRWAPPPLMRGRGGAGQSGARSNGAHGHEAPNVCVCGRCVLQTVCPLILVERR